MKIALLNAHTKQSPGATSGPPHNIVEYAVSCRANIAAADVLHAAGHEVLIVDGSAAQDRAAARGAHDPYAESLVEKVRVVNDWGAGVVVETHLDWRGNGARGGPAVLYWGASESSKKLADVCFAELCGDLPKFRPIGLIPIPSEGYGNKYLLHATHAPAVILEPLSLTDRSAVEFLVDASGPELIGRAVAMALRAYAETSTPRV